MACYQLIEKKDTITFQLNKWNAIFHFFFFRVYPYLLLSLGFGLMFLMAYESGPDKWLVSIGLLPIVIAIFMLLTQYTIKIDFTKVGIRHITKSGMRGTIERFFYSSQIKSLAFQPKFVRGNGLELHAKLNDGISIKLIEIPRFKRNKIDAINDLLKAANFMGYELLEEK